MWQLMHGADRVLLVQSDENNDVKSHHLVIPVSFSLVICSLYYHSTIKF